MWVTILPSTSLQSTMPSSTESTAYSQDTRPSSSLVARKRPRSVSTDGHPDDDDTSTAPRRLRCRARFVTDDLSSYATGALDPTIFSTTHMGGDTPSRHTALNPNLPPSLYIPIGPQGSDFPSSLGSPFVPIPRIQHDSPFIRASADAPGPRVSRRRPSPADDGNEGSQRGDPSPVPSAQESHPLASGQAEQQGQRPQTHPSDRASPVVSAGFSLIYLPTPVGGFPRVHRSDPESLTQNIHPQQLEDWLGHRQSTCVAIQVYGVGYPSSEAAKVVTDGIKDALVSLTKCATVEVSAPIAARDKRGDLTYPLSATYFAYNITEAAATELKKRVCWSTDALSFFAYDLSPAIPEFLFSLRGFTIDDPKVLAELVRKTLLSPHYRRFTISFALENPRFRGHTHDSIIDTIAQSLQVTVNRDPHSGSVVVNIYCTSPTTSPSLWRIWRRILASADYTNSFCCVGSQTRVLACSGCHGGDHSRSDCPFAAVLGWNGEHALQEHS
ncbi:hypothetical protein NUW54_g2218 [Trametes sanguinea]|uniref:Uncharacterized protein n=1 Tax=Trametes sanguinea TaxID=158606 RepID=A0ACC1Q7Z4_9APHY|nr:hypothetical protein NUW54_g2218 [Trametes sanguinea]